MSSPAQQLLGLRSLNGRVEAFGEDVTRTKAFTNKFAMGRKLVSLDGSFEWDEVTHSRSLAPVVGRDSPFPLRQELSVTPRRSSVADIKESKVISAERLYENREAGTLRPNAKAVIEMELRDLVNRIGATYEYMCAHTAQGTLTVSAANIPGTSMPFTVTYSPNTFTAAASWATAGTGILSSEVPALKTDYEQTCGLAPAQAIIGSTVEGYFLGNTQVTEYLHRAVGEKILTTAGKLRGPMFDGLAIGGLTWELTEGGYVPDGGSFTRYLAEVDRGILLPSNAELDQVLGMAEAHGYVPAQAMGPAESAADLVRPAPQAGWYAYATLAGPDHPTGVRIYVGYRGLPVLLRPAAVSVFEAVS